MNENEKKGWWASKSTGGKVRFILTQVVVLIALIILFGVIYCRQIFGDEFGDKVLGEGIENGWIALGTSAVENGTKVAVSLIVIFLLFLLDYVLSFVVRLTTRANKKARTIGSLIRSLIHYITVIVAIAVVLAVWGVDVASIVAGLGVLTLIIGLGCQVLIQDVISGLFLVFDDYFDVGDMVIIDGFRGYVSQIGLRSIKIDDRLGNIKSINNSSITSCVNLSREDNWVFFSIDVSYNEDPRRVEAILLRELPKLKDKLPRAIIPPTYLGLDTFGDAGISYKVYATCKAAYRFQLERDLKREVFLILKDNDVLIPYNQITINQADPKDRPSPTPSEQEIVNAFSRSIREAPKQEKKKGIFGHMKEAYEETVEETKKEAKEISRK